MKRISTIITLMTTGFLLMYMLTGCDVGVNPLWFDGTPVSAYVEIDTEESSFTGSGIVALNEAFAEIDGNVDSVDVFNITVRIEDHQSPSLASPASMLITVDGINLAAVSGLTLGDLLEEHSIIEPTGVEYIRNLLNSQPPYPTVEIFLNGEVDTDDPLKFTLVVTLYTQISVNP